MLDVFFIHAARSIGRQRTFRRLTAVHLLVLIGATFVALVRTDTPLFEIIGQTLVVLAIVEGAIIIGWRLTQLPKSRSLETLLLCPVPTVGIMLGEQMVGIVQLAFVLLSGLPVLGVLTGMRHLEPVAAMILLLFPFVWGAATGFGLTWWAYERRGVRKWGERISLVMLLFFLIVGGLLGEHTLRLLVALPYDLGETIYDVIATVHECNPFVLIHRIAEQPSPRQMTNLLWTSVLGATVTLLFIFRSAFRLKEHYIERHYRPVFEILGQTGIDVGNRPLRWWAVRRVTEYAGRINLYLAIGAAGLYATYLLFQNDWPAWLGRSVFHAFELLGGVAGMSAALVLLAGVPAAYQYGLWESSIPERCRRLEVFLLTELTAADYLSASWAASWHRGRGYFVTAIILWLAGLGANRTDLVHALLALLSGAVLVALYFSVGFRYFARTSGNATLGFALTVGLPLATWALASIGLESVARVLPPGMVFFAVQPATPILDQMLLLIGYAALASTLLATGLRRFDTDLRSWYDEHHGKR